MTYATFKGNRTSIIKPDEDPSDPRSSGVILTTPKNNEMELEEKYNDLLSKVNQLSKKKASIVNSIKIKSKNQELLQKARYASTGRDNFKNTNGDSGANFSLIHVAGVFLLFFVIGIYYSSG